VSKLLVAALAATVTDPATAENLGQPNDYLDELITFRQAAEELPRRRAGRKCAIQTFYRWSGPRGCKGVILRTTQVGCLRMTTRRWLAQFFEALAAKSRGETVAASSDQTAPLTQRTTAARRRAEEADRKLETMGVGL
jgi:hypothetical protein